MHAVLVMLFVGLMTIVNRVPGRNCLVVIVHDVTVGVLVVGNMRSLSHSEHQGVVEKE